ncbi:MAG: efflux RND transporter permease subunit, partial [Candidatus Wallbacteria bacterium]|nr:efflux RND transporter permease subunit [Candidatus Wallbacteria bacterium]
AGTYVPLREVASVSRGRAYTSIERRDGKRVIMVRSNVTPPTESENLLKSVLQDFMPGLLAKYPGLSYGFGGRQEDLREGVNSLKVGFIVGLLGIYALLAIPFSSYAQPIIIMVSIPFGIVGAVMAHVAMGYPLSLMSMMGIVALAGVVINNALIMIDFINRERNKGVSLIEAVHWAGMRRFRPILLTTLTTFGGLAPMIFEQSREARFMIPMAISLGFGIVFSTLITLILVPALCIVVDDLKQLMREAFPWASDFFGEEEVKKGRLPVS